VVRIHQKTGIPRSIPRYVASSAVLLCPLLLTLCFLGRSVLVQDALGLAIELAPFPLPALWWQLAALSADGYDPILEGKGPMEAREALLACLLWLAGCSLLCVLRHMCSRLGWLCPVDETRESSHFGRYSAAGLVVLTAVLQAPALQPTCTVLRPRQPLLVHCSCRSPSPCSALLCQGIRMQLVQDNGQSMRPHEWYLSFMAISCVACSLTLFQLSKDRSRNSHRYQALPVGGASIELGLQSGLPGGNGAGVK